MPVQLVLYVQKHVEAEKIYSIASTYITMKPATFVNTRSSSGEDAKLTLSTWWTTASPASIIVACQ